MILTLLCYAPLAAESLGPTTYQFSKQIDADDFYPTVTVVFQIVCSALRIVFLK